MLEAEPLCRVLQVVDDQQLSLYGPVAEGDLRAGILGHAKEHQLRRPVGHGAKGVPGGLERPTLVLEERSGLLPRRNKAGPRHPLLQALVLAVEPAHPHLLGAGRPFFDQLDRSHGVPRRARPFPVGEAPSHVVHPAGPAGTTIGA